MFQRKFFFSGGSKPEIIVSKEVKVIETPVVSQKSAPDEFKLGGSSFHLMFIPDKTTHSKEDEQKMVASYVCRSCQKKVAIFHSYDCFRDKEVSSIWSICYFCYLNETADISSKMKSPDNSFNLGDKEYNGFYVTADYLVGNIY